MRVRTLTYVGLLAAVACGEPYPSEIPVPGTGGSTNPGSTGGTTGGTSVPATGGTTGGTAVSTGGNQPSTGGAQTGGFSNTGGVTSTGGSSTGGSSATGGNTGGFGTGGSNSGGFGRGGSNSGGRNDTGGRSFGGSSSGGSSAGGSSAGGSSSGGSGGATALTFASLCASCHGEQGQGVAMKGPEIQHPVRDFATWVVRNGRQGHPSFPGQVMTAFPASALPDATLTSFFDALSTPALPKPTAGAALYTDYCANCHSATGTGGTAGHNAKGQTLSKALSMVRSGHSLTQFSSRNGYMPKWSTSELTDAEVGLIVDHLNSL